MKIIAMGHKIIFEYRHEVHNDDKEEPWKELIPSIDWSTSIVTELIGKKYKK